MYQNALAPGLGLKTELGNLPLKYPVSLENEDDGGYTAPCLELPVIISQSRRAKSFAASQSVGQGWEVVGKYSEGQKSYEKIDTVPVVVIDEEPEKTHKTRYIRLYSKLFVLKHQK